MLRKTICPLILLLLTGTLCAADPQILFDGKTTDQWEFREGAWVIEADGSLCCRMEEVKAKNETKRQRGMGYIWTRQTYGDFELQLQYKLSESANSGVFYRSDPNDPVQKGFEIQLLDDEGFQKVKGKKDGKNLNGSVYDAQAASSNSAKPVGQWNRLKLTCRGPLVKVEINGVVVNEANLDRWETPRKNPDGSANKFKTALKDLPRKGQIGFQNHGQFVWFKDVSIRPL
ncbi:MAG: DUF1080 domain-containing protein [Rubripirellula sp.]|jgi:hypothetical protein|nr:DUF1080 domain-containing protein [Rubripirellula sp.]